MYVECYIFCDWQRSEKAGWVVSYMLLDVMVSALLCCPLFFTFPSKKHLVTCVWDFYQCNLIPSHVHSLPPLHLDVSQFYTCTYACAVLCNLCGKTTLHSLSDSTKNPSEQQPSNCPAVVNLDESDEELIKMPALWIALSYRSSDLYERQRGFCTHADSDWERSSQLYK